MNKFLKFATGIALSAAVLVAPFGQQASAEFYGNLPIQLNVKGKLLDRFANPSIVVNGNTLVPMRVLFEELGAKVTWNGKTQSVKAAKEGTTIEMTVGSKTAKLNGKVVSMNVSPRVEKGTVLIPARFVSESLGMYVNYYEPEKQIYIDQDKEIEGTTMAGVKALYEKYKPTHTGEVYDEKPSFSGTFKAGKLKASVLKDALNSVNFVREMAKLPLLTMDEQINADTQIGTTVQAAQGGVTHTPRQTAGMPNDFYATGLEASHDSSLVTAGNYKKESEFLTAAIMWSSDGQEERLGHRKAMLDPTLTAVGFGYSYNPMYPGLLASQTLAPIAMNTRETGKSNYSNYDYITWPSKGYFPTNWMEQNTKFGITLNSTKFSEVSYYNLKGTVTNKTTGEKFNLVPDQTEEFYLHPASYGAGQTISFPFRDEYNYDNVVQAGNEYEVNITGVTKTDGTPYPIKYTVKFFSM